MKNKKKTKKDQKAIIDWIVKIVLIIIIIILFIHNCELTKKNNSKPTSTGNVHIIEIKCDSTKTCEPVKPDDKPNNNGGKNNNGGNNTNQDIEEGDLTVFDRDIEWDGVTEAKIFTNSMYELEDTIAPESSNTYQFVVKNSNNFKIKYDISFIENNPYHANMKYKLKKNSTYIIDQYVSADELIAQNIMLDANNNDTFYLEWKWVSSSNDTEIGRIGNATYGLKIEVKAESV